MKIVLRPHLKIRLEQRKIPLKRLRYNQKLRLMVVAYDIIGDEIQVITIHPIAKQEIDNKVRVVRWTIYEKS